MSDPTNTQGAPGADEEADTASGGAPEEPSGSRHDGSTVGTDSDDGEAVQERLDDQTTDDEGKPLENPSGG